VYHPEIFLKFLLYCIEGYEGRPDDVTKLGQNFKPVRPSIHLVLFGSHTSPCPFQTLRFKVSLGGRGVGADDFKHSLGTTVNQNITNYGWR